ncbi:MAG: exo-alpha-sialidase [Chloroflexi bacterium]|nr:exo-alpha-sialidase [Chloroflexota bacterium]
MNRLLAKILMCLTALVLGGLSSAIFWSNAQMLPAAAVPVPPATPAIVSGDQALSALPPAPTTAPATPTALANAPQSAPVANVPNVRVSRDEFTAHSEVSLAQNPREPQNFVGASKMFTDNENYVFRIGTYASSDGGKSWIDNGQLPGLEQFEITSDPVVAFDGSGTAYVEVLAARGPDQRSALYLYSSTDGGRSWSTPQLVTDDRSGFNDKNWLTADITGGQYDGALYTTWVQIVGARGQEDEYRILFARSIDGGTTWSAPQKIAGNPGVVRQGPNVSVDPQGDVYLLWSNLSANHLESAASTDGGAIFSEVREGPQFQNIRPLKGDLRNGLVLAGVSADPVKPDTLYAVWGDWRLGEAEVAFSVTHDGGKTWRSPVVVNGVRTNDQFQPTVAANKVGEIYIQWFDRRDDRNNLLVHTYAARSTDDGQTWSELRVTDVASNPTVGLPRADEDGFYGDYQALVADETGVQLFWNETRDGQQEVYTARIPRDRWGKPYIVPKSGPVQSDPTDNPEANESSEQK